MLAKKEFYARYWKASVIVTHYTFCEKELIKNVSSKIIIILNFLSMIYNCLVVLKIRIFQSIIEMELKIVFIWGYTTNLSVKKV